MFGQVLTNDGKIITSPYRYIPNDVSAWTVQSGTFANNPADNSVICTSTGVAYFENNQAYGEWYFDMYWLSNGYFSVYFLQKTTTFREEGYEIQIRVSPAGQYLLIKCNVSCTILQAASAFFTSATWKQFKVTRDATGLFSTYTKVNGVWTLIPVTSGTNPTTENTNQTGNYFIVGMGTGEKIRNIRFKPSTGFSTIVKQ